MVPCSVTVLTPPSGKLFNYATLRGLNTVAPRPELVIALPCATPAHSPTKPRLPTLWPSRSMRVPGRESANGCHFGHHFP